MSSRISLDLLNLSKIPSTTKTKKTHLVLSIAQEAVVEVEEVAIKVAVTTTRVLIKVSTMRTETNLRALMALSLLQDRSPSGTMTSLGIRTATRTIKLILGTTRTLDPHSNLRGEEEVEVASL